jgi:hypothetical protein
MAGSTPKFPLSCLRQLRSFSPSATRYYSISYPSISTFSGPRVCPPRCRWWLILALVVLLVLLLLLCILWAFCCGRRRRADKGQPLSTESTPDRATPPRVTVEATPLRPDGAGKVVRLKEGSPTLTGTQPLLGRDGAGEHITRVLPTMLTRVLAAEVYHLFGVLSQDGVLSQQYLRMLVFFVD